MNTTTTKRNTEKQNNEQVTYAYKTWNGLNNDRIGYTSRAKINLINRLKGEGFKKDNSNIKNIFTHKYDHDKTSVQIMTSFLRRSYNKFPTQYARTPSDITVVITGKSHEEYEKTIDIVKVWEKEFCRNNYVMTGTYTN